MHWGLGEWAPGSQVHRGVRPFDLGAPRDRPCACCGFGLLHGLRVWLDLHEAQGAM